MKPTTKLIQTIYYIIVVFFIWFLLLDNITQGMYDFTQASHKLP
jgi:hypothetical protein